MKWEKQPGKGPTGFEPLLVQLSRVSVSRCWCWCVFSVSCKAHTSSVGTFRVAWGQEGRGVTEGGRGGGRVDIKRGCGEGGRWLCYTYFSVIWVVITTKIQMPQIISLVTPVAHCVDWNGNTVRQNW